MVAGAQPDHPDVPPGRKGRDYDKIWNRERNESFLKTITRAQSDKLGAELAGEPRILVDWAMRYGNPSIRVAAWRPCRPPVATAF